MKSHSVTTIFLFSLFVVCTFQMQAQTSTASYQQVREDGGHLSEIAHNKFGNLYSGKTIEEIPGGSVLEVTPLGRGYFKAKSFKTGAEGIIGNAVEVKQEFIEPRNTLGKFFECSVYEVEYPSLGDLPKEKCLLSVMNGEEPNEAKVKIRRVINPDTRNERVEEKVYYGRFLPNCISIKSVSENGVKKPFDEFRIYVGFHTRYANGNKAIGVVDAVYIDGKRWNIVSDQ